MKKPTGSLLGVKAVMAAVAGLACAGKLAADVSPFFDWTPNNAPTGWITSWKGEANDVTTAMIGPDGTTTNLYAVTASGTTWSPYNSDAVAKSDYTLSFYGSVENVTAGSGGPAVLWCMGKSANGGMTMLVKDSESHLLLVSVPSGAKTASRTIDAGLAPNGFHLFTVRFSTTGGASVQIDDGLAEPEPCRSRAARASPCCAWSRSIRRRFQTKISIERSRLIFREDAPRPQHTTAGHGQPRRTRGWFTAMSRGFR